MLKTRLSEAAASIMNTDDTIADVVAIRLLDLSVLHARLRELATLEANLNAQRQKISLEQKRILQEIQLRCQHTHQKYWPDPSGNNGSWRECLDCGADL